LRQIDRPLAGSEFHARTTLRRAGRQETGRLTFYFRENLVCRRCANRYDGSESSQSTEGGEGRGPDGPTGQFAISKRSNAMQERVTVYSVSQRGRERRNGNRAAWMLLTAALRY
jgi:hypothetical protein